MDEWETRTLGTRALGDQAIEHLREYLPEIQRIARMDSAQWSERDRDIAQMTLFFVEGMLLEKRV